MAETLTLEVDENENCPRMPAMAYEALAAPAGVARVRLAEPGRPPGLYHVTGWSSAGGGSPCPALYAPVSDSGGAVVHLVYGGDWGVRLKPLDAEEDWDLQSPRQFGEPYLMLFEEGDVRMGGGEETG